MGTLEAICIKNISKSEELKDKKLDVKSLKKIYDKKMNEFCKYIISSNGFNLEAVSSVGGVSQNVSYDTISRALKDHCLSNGDEDSKIIVKELTSFFGTDVKFPNKIFFGWINWPKHMGLYFSEKNGSNQKEYVVRLNEYCDTAYD